MKTLKFCLLLTATLLLISNGCQKPDLDPDYFGDEAGVLKKGKPGPSTYPLSGTDTPIQVYGVWHAGNDYCTWGTIRETGPGSEFDLNNKWLIDRGDGKPSVNLVVLSFVNPLVLLNHTTEQNPLGGIPVGMTQEVVDYFQNHGIRVMLSIGGITYTDDWNTALATNATKLGSNAALVAGTLGVGIEIDYEENSSPNLSGLQAFIVAYRNVHSFDATGTNPAARLTIDLAAGDRWLIDICREATKSWLQTSNPVLDYANAMVPARQPSAAGALENWYEHIIGKPQYAPPILPLAPCKFTGSLYITGTKATTECVDFYSSIHYINKDFVRQIQSQLSGATPGMLGYMFWAAECPSTRQLCATDCTGGIGEGSRFFDITVPMPMLRQN